MKFVILFVVIQAVRISVAQQRFIEIPKPYDFQYKVENSPTRTYFGQNEVGDANGRISGSYYVYLPDGRLMSVDYVADHNGYVPRVRYQSNAQYPYIHA